jgi:hypothetical protein
VRAAVVSANTARQLGYLHAAHLAVELAEFLCVVAIINQCSNPTELLSRCGYDSSAIVDLLLTTNAHALLHLVSPLAVSSSLTCEGDKSLGLGCVAQ